MATNYRPTVIRTVVLPAFSFRATAGRYPAARKGELQQKEGTCVVRPTFCFRPRDAQKEAASYPVKIRVYLMQNGQLHGVAEPLTEALLTREELLEIQQIRRQVTFHAGDRGLIAADEATGMIILPASDWEEKMGQPPVAGEGHWVLLEEYPNKFVAHPVQLGVSEQDVKTQALVLAEDSGMATLFHKTHVLSPNGERWLHFRAVLRLNEVFTEADVKRQFRNLGGEYHPDKKEAEGGTLKASLVRLAEEKMRCLQAARDLALDWLKGCSYTLKSGKRKGERCGKKRVEQSAYCAAHGIDESAFLGEMLKMFESKPDSSDAGSAVASSR